MPGKQKNRLFLLDGMALIYRAHFALIRTPVFTSGGFNSSALLGFTNTLLDIMQQQKPTHLALVFDTAAPTARHRVFPEYKAQRQEMPEDISAAIPEVKRLAEAFNIRALALDGYEADDIIGTLALRADASGEFDTFMVTPDKDFAQLVSERCSIYKPGRQGNRAEILGLPEILDQWQIERPEQVIDILGLWGDASDNIPGVPGIGEKTAKKLVQKFGSVEGLLDNTGELKGKQKENVIEFAGQARLSRELATIDREAPVEVSFDELKLRDKDDERLKSFFVEFEFNTLGKRLFGDAFKAGRGAAVARDGQGKLFADLKTIRNINNEYRHVVSAEERAQLIAALSRQKAFCFDAETSSLDPQTCALLGLAFSWETHRAYYVSLPQDEPEQSQAVLREFAPLFADRNKEIVGHNLKFDIAVLLWQGIEVEAALFDTMLAHGLIRPDQRHQMDRLSEAYLGYTPIPISSLIGARDGDEPQRSMAEVSASEPERVAEYAAEDADVTWQISEKFRPLLTEAGQDKVFHEVECPLVPVLVLMEKEGVSIDAEALVEVGRELGARAAETKAKVFEDAGAEFNLDSPKQLGEILFEKLRLVEKPKKTKTGQYATGEQVLSSLAPNHAIVKNILDYREATKLKNTYVDTLPNEINPRTGKIHTTFHQLLAVTGRLASHNPNLQNIPIRSEQGREIRKAFIPSGPDCLLLSADYSQIELRVMASLSGDEAMCRAFQEGRDIHAATAAAVYGVGLDEVLPDMRRTAKMVNFGIIYGISAFGLSQRLGIPRKEAATMIEEYFKLYPGVKAFMDRTVAEATERGYVETVTGRRRYLRDITSSNWTVRSAAERTAINTPIQGTAADMIKIAMIRVHEALRREKVRTRMILQVHDELVFDLRRDEELLVVPLVEQCMREALPLDVPIVVDSGTGANWLEAH